MSRNNKILVFGGVGQYLKKISKEINFQSMLFLDEKEGDILDLDHLLNLFVNERPSFVANFAAYTAVDKTEDDVFFVKTYSALKFLIGEIAVKNA